MQGQVLQTTSTTPSVDVFFFDADGLPLTTLDHNTAGLTLQYVRGITAPVTIARVAQTPTGAWVSGGFCHVAGGKYRLDLPIAAIASGLPQVAIVASALPAGARMAPFVVGLTPDDLTVAGPSVAGIWSAPTRTLTGGAGSAPTAAENAAAVRSNLATELARLDAPVSSALSAATLSSQLGTLRQALGVGARFGGPVAGGTASPVQVFDPGNSAVLLGTVIIYRDANGNVVGQSELTPP